VSPATAATLGPSAYWYLTRGTGAVALVLLTVSVAIGIAGSLRVTGYRWPRFAIDAVHRDVSLLAIALLLVHIVTSVLDGFAPIALTAAVIPFISTYRPFWLGLGALAFDLLLAIAITSLVRRRLGYRRWRAIHWLAYASWPIAVLHGLGTGTDTKVWWMLALTAACGASVVIAVCARIAFAEPSRPVWRAPAFALSIAAPVALLAFTVLGPLRQGWARRAGTPANLVAAAHPRHAPAPPRHAPALTGASKDKPKPFSAALAGSVRQARLRFGSIVDLRMRLSGGATGRLRVRLGGVPIPGGGLTLRGSQVDLITDGIPSVLQGKVSSLTGDHLVAHVRGSSGTALNLDLRLHLNTQASSVTGHLSAAPTARS
jgi:sulfoxide reductase heme-binding subunit YedZ